MTNLDVTVRRETGTTHYPPGARALTRAAAAILGLLVEAYRARRDAEHLKSLNAHLLRDLGIERGEIDRVVRHGRAPRP